MPKAYSLDLRERVVRYVDAVHSRRAAAMHFDVSLSFVVNLMRAWGSRSRISVGPLGGRRFPSSIRAIIFSSPG